jgi:serine phosphatase RsbU (regulator of sigma subunit)
MTENQSRIEWGVAAVAQPGQQHSGDQYVVSPLADGLLVAVIDGLGHGPKAAVAAEAAVAALNKDINDNLTALMQRCHTALVGTRGAVMSLASINAATGNLTWLSVGNVVGMLMRADRHMTPAREHLLLRGGVVGYRMPPLREFTEPIYPGDTLILATDGIRSGFMDDIPLHLAPQAMADNILDRYNRKTDDATIVVARFVG